MIPTRIVFGLLLLGFFSTATFAEAERKKAAGKEKEDPAHAELRALRKSLVEAVNKLDIEAILANCDSDVVLTAQHAEFARGHDGLKKYLEKFVKGPDKILESYKVEPTVDSLSILHGDDTAIAYGSSKDEFVLTDGTRFTLQSRWTATLVKKDGKWLVASLHSSANVMDNAILKKATGWIWKGAAIAGGVGLLLGLIIMAALKRGKPAPSVAGGES